MVQRDSMIRVAFWFDAPIAYSGGLNYISNVLHALSVVNKSEVQPFVFFSDDVPQAVIARFERYATVVLTPVLQRKTFSWLVHKVAYKMFGSMAVVNFLMRRHGIELVSHVWTPYLGDRSIKVIAWIPDFQYLHLPEMFPNLDVDKENLINLRIATHADAVIVSSEHALGDLLSLHSPEILPPVEVLRFVSQPFITPGINGPEIGQLRKKYGFTGKFFLLPNQFWAHKNHEVVLRAIAISKREGKGMTVLMTGNPKDYRLSGAPYIDGLRDIIKNEGIEKEAIILGMIDYNDLMTLLRHCVAIINPSRFEGWSSSVEEGKSAGKPVLLSNIPVHVEQAPPRGAYFGCDDPVELKRLMVAHWEAHEKQNHEALAEEARRNLVERTEKFGYAYLNLIRRVAGQGTSEGVSA